MLGTQETILAHGRGQPPNGSVSELDLTAHGFGFKRILLPLDLCGEPEALWPVAASMARRSGAQLVLLHALPLNLAGEARGIHRTRLVNELCGEAQAKLLRIAKLLAARLEPEIVIGLGAADKLILDAARRLDIDMIVMQTRRKSRWTRWLHRNTARKVTCRAACTVWLVPTGLEPKLPNLIVLHRARPRQAEREDAITHAKSVHDCPAPC